MKSFHVVQMIIITNGIYNIIAALSILNLLHIPYIRNVYFDMITDYDNNNIMFERFVAYTMLANGIIRVLNGITLHDSTSKYVVSGTFFLEALILSNEHFVFNRIDPTMAWITIVLSLYLGYSSILYQY
jgi:hypothetical protein